MQIVEEPFGRFIRSRDDQPGPVAQVARLRLHERGEGEAGRGAVQAGDRGTACLGSQCRGDRREPLGCCRGMDSIGHCYGLC